MKYLELLDIWLNKHEFASCCYDKKTLREVKEYFKETDCIVEKVGTEIHIWNKLKRRKHYEINNND